MGGYHEYPGDWQDKYDPKIRLVIYETELVAKRALIEQLEDDCHGLEVRINGCKKFIAEQE